MEIYVNTGRFLDLKKVFDIVDTDQFIYKLSYICVSEAPLTVAKGIHKK